jgi:hypothetical protein
MAPRRKCVNWPEGQVVGQVRMSRLQSQAELFGGLSAVHLKSTVSAETTFYKATSQD